jgi:hypothetical protein
MANILLLQTCILLLCFEVSRERVGYFVCGKTSTYVTEFSSDNQPVLYDMDNERLVWFSRCVLLLQNYLPNYAAPVHCDAFSKW